MMLRLSPLLSFLLLGLGFCASSGLSSAAGEGRPNILWLTCEDISPDLGCYGDSYARTPSLDRFASRGVLYLNAFGVTGVCAVNRSCLITGMYSSTLGSQGMRSQIKLPDHIKCFTEHLREAGYYCSNNSKTDYNFQVPERAWDESSNKAHYTKRREGQPFFAVFNYTGSHESKIRENDKAFAKRTSQLTADQRHDPARVSVPPFHPDTPEVRRDWARYHDLITGLDYWVAAQLEELEEAALAEDTIVFFFSDHGAGMPGCKKWVWDSGLHVPLMVYFPKRWQHLAPAGPATRADRLVSFVDFAPTVLSLAGVTVPEHMQGAAFLGEQAEPPRELVFGIRDRMAERFDTVRFVRNKRFQYLRNYMPHLSWSQFVNYTEQMPTMQLWRELHESGKLNGRTGRYFQAAKPVEELYDTRHDPHQIHNLANDPAHRGTLEKMRAQCVEQMKLTGDLGLLPEYEMVRRSDGRTPFHLAFDPGTNPLPQLQDAADLANRMEVGKLPALRDLMLNSKDPALRWWGAVGLVALKENAARAAEALSEATRDPSPNVRVAAAEALANIGQLETALAALKLELGHESPHIRLRAINVLDRLGKKALPLVREMKASTQGLKPGTHKDVASYLSRMATYVPQRLTRKPPK